jgi:plasmid maintenance system killer protein
VTDQKRYTAVDRAGSKHLVLTAGDEERGWRMFVNNEWVLSCRFEGCLEKMMMAELERRGWKIEEPIGGAEG